MESIALLMAVGTGLGVPIGALTLGYMVDRQYARGARDAQLRVFAVIGLIFPAAGLVLVTAHSLTIASVAVFLCFLVSGISSMASAIPLATPAHFRGQVSAFYLLVGNLLGLGLGPSLVALLTDLVFADVSKLLWSIGLVLAICGPLATLVLLWGRPAMRRAVAECGE